MKIVRGVWGGNGKPRICLVTGMMIYKGSDFVLAMLVGFRDPDHCLVVNDICITLVMTLWVGWGGGALNSSLCVSAFK